MIEIMNELMIYFALVVFGAVFGSFAAASVWRIRAKQLDEDKKAKEPYDHKEYAHLKKLLGKKVMDDHSQCLHCGYTLRWYDLIPIVSWVVLRGKCRNCHKPIGVFELLMELGVAAFFVLSYLLWPNGIETNLDIVHLILWLIAGVIMSMMFAYDAKWFLLPNSLVIALVVAGVGVVSIQAIQSQDVVGTILSALASVGVLAGIYLLLWLVSRGRWVGFGDIKLGVGLGLLLINWELALVAFVLANVIGCLYVIPLLLAKKVSRMSRIPFGPFLILGTIIAMYAGWPIIGAYLGVVGL